MPMTAAVVVEQPFVGPEPERSAGAVSYDDATPVTHSS